MPNWLEGPENELRAALFKLIEPSDDDLQEAVRMARQKQYDYDIQTERLSPPIAGGHRYAAKVGFLVRLRENSQSERVAHDLGEVWGRSEQEAFLKMKKAVEAWIDQHSG